MFWVPVAVAADSGWSPLPVALECQSEERVSACTYLRAMLNDLGVAVVVPRADADLVLYVNVTVNANDDQIHLRAVGEVPGAPPAFEQPCPVDARLAVDAQIARITPCVGRVLAPFVAARLPESVTVTFAAPKEAPADRSDTPWGFEAWGGGWGSWTPRYQELSVWTGAALYTLSVTDRALWWVAYDRSIQRQPSLDVGGEEVVLFSDSTEGASGLFGAHNLTDHWTVGAVARGGHDDPEGQYYLTLRQHVGIEHNWFPSNDPRGNRLAAVYLIGVQADWYNQINAIGEEKAVFPTHIAVFEGDVRFDTVELGVALTAAAEVLRPDRRYALSIEGEGELMLGNHVELGFSSGVTQQAIPGPGALDSSSFEQVTRASYAEPLQMWGNLNLRLHWDNTNSAQNNRFEAAKELDATGNL